MNKDFVLETRRNDKIRISTYGFENLTSASCLVFVHGFKGFKDWGFGPYTGKYFSDRGYFVITFNFSHNGIGENETEFTELDKFAENTFSLEIEELNQVIDAYKNGFFGKTPDLKTGILGHSRGGAISLLTSVNNSVISAVAVWSSVSDLNRYSKRQKEEWRKKGVFEVLNTRTKQVMRLNVTLLDDIEKNNNGSLNIENAVKKLNKPLLIIHSEQDLAAPIEEGEKILSWADKTKTEFHKIQASGHTFNVKHPFEGSNPKFDFVLNKTSEFFNKHLN